MLRPDLQLDNDGADGWARLLVALALVAALLLFLFGAIGCKAMGKAPLEAYAGLGPARDSAAPPATSGSYAARAIRVVVLARAADGYPEAISGAEVSVFDPVDLVLRRAVTDANGSAVLVCTGTPEVWVSVDGARERVTEAPQPDLLLPHTHMVTHVWEGGR